MCSGCHKAMDVTKQGDVRSKKMPKQMHVTAKACHSGGKRIKVKGYQSTTMPREKEFTAKGCWSKIMSQQNMTQQRHETQQTLAKFHVCHFQILKDVSHESFAFASSTFHGGNTFLRDEWNAVICKTKGVPEDKCGKQILTHGLLVLLTIPILETKISIAADMQIRIIPRFNRLGQHILTVVRIHARAAWASNKIS